jgi:carbamoyltransferase
MFFVLRRLSGKSVESQYTNGSQFQEDSLVSMNIVGIGYSLHESSACVVQDGQLRFACAEERLSGVKQDSSFPVRAIRAALDYCNLDEASVDHVAIGWSKPGSTSRHDLAMMLKRQFPASAVRLERSLLGWLKSMRHQGGMVDFRRAFRSPRATFHFVDHHLAHALSAYCLSGFSDAAILVIDGRGASEATTLWHGANGSVRLLEKYEFPNSLGVFYAGVTEALGFKPLSDEWKVMGLASYGEPRIDLSELIQVLPEGYNVAGRKFFGPRDGITPALRKLLGPPHSLDDLTQADKDLARSAQAVCEEAMLALLRRATRLSGSRRLCLAGGVALNCKANGELLRSGLIDDIYVQPAASDDGTCIGAAFGVYSALNRVLPSHRIAHSYLGTEYSNKAIEETLKVYKLDYQVLQNPSRSAARLLQTGALLGWYQGRMEFGPRALGNRSILADARIVENRDRVNSAVKFRESWRPFAPSVIEEQGHLYFHDFRSSPYMILSFWATDRAKTEIPAVVHVDGSCRVQSVTRDSNPRYYELLVEFERLTGVGAIMNTSFNLKGDAIVESPKDAIETYFTSGLDYLIIGDFVVFKSARRPDLID